MNLVEGGQQNSITNGHIGFEHGELSAQNVVRVLSTVVWTFCRKGGTLLATLIFKHK